MRGGEATASSRDLKVPFTRQAVAKHLAILQSAGLVTRRKEGREVLSASTPAAWTTPPAP